jgi:hypothetical protein
MSLLRRKEWDESESPQRQHNRRDDEVEDKIGFWCNTEVDSEKQNASYHNVDDLSIENTIDEESLEEIGMFVIQPKHKENAEPYGAEYKKWRNVKREPIERWYLKIPH